MADAKHDPKHTDPPAKSIPLGPSSVPSNEPRHLSDPAVLEAANINTHSQDWEIPQPRYVGPPNTTFAEPEHRGKLVDDGHETSQEEQLRRSQEDEQKRVQHGLKAEQPGVKHASA